MVDEEGRGEAVPEVEFPDPLPKTYQELQSFFVSQGEFSPFALREETFRRIEERTERPLLCYVAQIHDAGTGMPVDINDRDLVGFGDLIDSVEGDAADLFIVSNGGSAEAAERIVRLLRARFEELRFIVPSNAYSAATLLCLAGDSILMDAGGTLGPIDPQIRGVPARAILRAFAKLEERLKEEGPKALTAYVPLLQRYDLHLLEICTSAQELSKELAKEWLGSYMLKDRADEEEIEEIVDSLSSYDLHKSHGRSIDRAKALELGLMVQSIEEVDPELRDLVRCLYHQHLLFFEKTPFCKLFENAHGVHWGRQFQISTTYQSPFGPQLPGATAPDSPAPPEPSDTSGS